VEKFLFAVEGAHRKVRALERRAVPLVFEEEKRRKACPSTKNWAAERWLKELLFEN
jgi:hypothetical protein